MKTNWSSDIMGEAEKLFSQPSAPSNELDWSSPVPDKSLAHLSVFQQIRETLSRYGAQPLVDRFIAKLAIHDKSGKDPSEWPAELRIQEFPVVAGPTA